LRDLDLDAVVFGDRGLVCELGSPRRDAVNDALFSASPDAGTASRNVRYVRIFGVYILTESFTAFDPNRTRH